MAFQRSIHAGVVDTLLRTHTLVVELRELPTRGVGNFGQDLLEDLHANPRWIATPVRPRLHVARLSEQSDPTNQRGPADAELLTDLRLRQTAVVGSQDSFSKGAWIGSAHPLRRSDAAIPRNRTLGLAERDARAAAQVVEGDPGLSAPAQIVGHTPSSCSLLGSAAEEIRELQPEFVDLVVTIDALAFSDEDSGGLTGLFTRCHVRSLLDQQQYSYTQSGAIVSGVGYMSCSDSPPCESGTTQVVGLSLEQSGELRLLAASPALQASAESLESCSELSEIGVGQ